jgi:hypothetical protein
MAVLAGHQYIERLKEPNSFQSRELGQSCCQRKAVIVLAVDSPSLCAPAIQRIPIVNFSDWQRRYEGRLQSLLNWFVVQRPEEEQ